MRSERPTARAVVLARGLGRRMREADSGVSLSPEQQRAADAGLKAMMPVNGRPFLDFVLSSLADAGLRHVALVVAPDHDLLREYLADTPPSRVTVDFVVQADALGTANAVLAAREWTNDDPFMVMNADNLYPVEALRALAMANEPAFPAFDADDLVRTSNIPADRIRAFAMVRIDEAGYLTGIVEKPNPGASGSSPKISMNCWRFDGRIFDACREVPKSARGEYELPEAVGLATARGMRLKAISSRGPVLDLSRRADAADVARRLAGVTPCP